MQVLVLAGGLGTRLGAISKASPKSMVDVCGYPFIYWQLRLMKWYGFKRFLLCTGYMGKEIEGYFRDGSKMGIQIEYSRDGGSLLGTGGAIRNALSKLDDEFLVIYGDSLMDVNYFELIHRYELAKKNESMKGMMVVYRNEGRFDRSNVLFSNGKISVYDKKCPLKEMQHIDYGISILRRKAVQDWPQGNFDLSIMYHDYASDGLLESYETCRRFHEIGSVESLEETRRFIHDRYIRERQAAFLDRDGTLNEIVFNDDTGLLDSPLKPEQLKLLPGTIDTLRILAARGYLLILVTNQPAAAKGKTTLAALYDVNRRLLQQFREAGVEVDEILMCEHHPEGGLGSAANSLVKDCDCRKPKPGLIRRAMDKFKIDMGRSFMIGDSYIDILTGKAAGVPTVFLGAFKCDSCQMLREGRPDYIYGTLFAFADAVGNGTLRGGQDEI